MNNYFKVVQNLIMTFSKVVFFGKNSSIAISDLKCGAGGVFSKYKFHKDKDNNKDPLKTHHMQIKQEIVPQCSVENFITGFLNRG